MEGWTVICGAVIAIFLSGFGSEGMYQAQSMTFIELKKIDMNRGESQPSNKGMYGFESLSCSELCIRLNHSLVV